MSDSLRKNLICYGITLSVSLLVAAAIAATRTEDALWTVAAVERYRILCDAFTVPGMLLLMSGLLMSVANEGAFDGFGYVMSVAGKMLVPGGMKKLESYSAYRERRHGKKIHGYGFLFICGAAMMAVAGIYLALFYSVF